MPATRKKRIPQLKHTDVRNIGWHVSYRDPNTGTPRKYIIGNVPKSTANEAYQKWLAAARYKNNAKRKLMAGTGEPTIRRPGDC